MMPTSGATGAPQTSPTPRQEATAGPIALQQVREAANALLAEGKVGEAMEFFASALEAVLQKSRELELLVAKLRREQYGKKSERLDPRQLQLLFEVFCSQAREAGATVEMDPEAVAREDAELNREITEAEEARGEGKGRRKRGSRVRTGTVERQVHHHEVPEPEKICKHCGRVMGHIGEDVTRRLEYVPGHFIEHEDHRDKFACGTCKDGVTTAPGPDKVIERSPADASVLAHVVVSKIVDYCPLHRLHRMFDRIGVDIPVSTMSDWVAQVADLLSPLADRLTERVLAAYIDQMDATGVRVLDPKSPDNIQRGTMWCYVGDELDAVFRYTPTGEGATGPWEFLAGRTGYLQADAATVFDRLFKGRAASAVEVGCWSHARRKLTDLQDMDCRVAYPLKLIARLFRIEHLADAKGLSPDERVALRQERSRPVLEKIKRWLAAMHGSEPPGTDLAKAVGYMIRQWEALNRFLHDGRLRLHNNLVEQQLRSIALGRNNFLFFGSHQAAARAAVLYTITRTCALRGVPPLAYLTDVLRKLAAGWPQSRLDELLPDRWQPATVAQ
ncbi:MAG: IS66 family transposase [Planctomycetes bacterium]|nr:IS66 family transposase [Planctomycetota bacterium]